MGPRAHRAGRAGSNGRQWRRVRPSDEAESEEAARVPLVRQNGVDDVVAALESLPFDRFEAIRIHGDNVLEAVLIRQARATVQMTRFNVGDRVSFIAHGEDKEGTVIRLNKKTVSIAVDDGHQWNVAPGLLKLVQSAGDELWLG